MSSSVLVFLVLNVLVANAVFTNMSRLERALQKDHEKPREEKWMQAFLVKNRVIDQTPSLVKLLIMITKIHLGKCATLLLYDNLLEKVYPGIRDKLLRIFPTEFVLGHINKQYKLSNPHLLNEFPNKCVNYILFVHDIMKCKHLIGVQNTNKVVIISSSSQWRVQEFLHSDISHGFVNLLVIAQSDKVIRDQEVSPFILYTHNLYNDGLGASASVILTSWMNGKLTNPRKELFPPKFRHGFSGHRFIISLANQPPFTIKRYISLKTIEMQVSTMKGNDEYGESLWDGIDVRLVKMLGTIFNFTTDFREPPDVNTLGPAEAILKHIASRKANLGLGGIYVTRDRIGKVDMSQTYSQDCASFISVASTAIPRWRAIMGPFHWTVWLTLTLVYLLAIFPLSFSDQHSLRFLCEKPQEMEDLFWYVFGTFTNCFTFSSKSSWTKSHKYATRLLIGFYWLFTIIITSCYTGSIIAFVTLTVSPETVDTANQLLYDHYQIGTLDKDGWQYWFNDTVDPVAKQLLERVDLVPTIEDGLKNTTKAFFWSYAFLGSRAQLDYSVRTSFVTKNKKSLLHISKECFVPFSIGFAFNKNENYKEMISKGLMRAVETGFLVKFTHDVEWDTMRSATGRLLQANSGGSLRVFIAEDRALTVKDTEGMFILLGFGILLGAASLLSEWLGGCFNFCKRRASSALSCSTSRRALAFRELTPREKLDLLYPTDQGVAPPQGKNLKEEKNKEEVEKKVTLKEGSINKQKNSESPKATDDCDVPTSLNE